MAFSDNVWWTRKARIQTEKRLLANAFQSQLLLLWYSFCSVATAVYYLSFSDSSSNPGLAGTAWVIFSVLVLVISGFINGLSFKERAGLIKECYETLSKIYQQAKSDNSDISLISTEYNQILGVCENHTDRDYYLALCLEHLTNAGKIDKETGLTKDLDRRPTKYHWLALTFWLLCRLLMLAFLYALPVVIFVSLEFIS